MRPVLALSVTLLALASPAWAQCVNLDTGEEFRCPSDLDDDPSVTRLGDDIIIRRFQLDDGEPITDTQQDMGDGVVIHTLTDTRGRQRQITCVYGYCQTLD